jgi:hypothetical protein
LKQFATSSFHVELIAHFLEEDYTERYMREYLVDFWGIPKEFRLREMFLIHEDDLDGFVKFSRQIDGCLDPAEIEK